MKFMINTSNKAEKKIQKPADIEHNVPLKNVWMAKCNTCGNEYYGERSKGQAAVCSLRHEAERKVLIRRLVDLRVRMTLETQRDFTIGLRRGMSILNKSISN